MFILARKLIIISKLCFIYIDFNLDSTDENFKLICQNGRSGDSILTSLLTLLILLQLYNIPVRNLKD